MKPTIIVVSHDGEAAAARVAAIRTAGRAYARPLDASRWDGSPETDAHGYEHLDSGHEGDAALADLIASQGYQAPDQDYAAVEPVVVEPVVVEPVVVEAPKRGSRVKSEPKAE